MPYSPDLYINNEKNTCRFALGCTGSNPLLVLGLNPSTADDHKPDQTIRRVMGFAERGGFDGFIMLNLYPQRTPYPHQLHKRLGRELHQQNLHHIHQAVSELSAPSILAAWGSNISIRAYLARCLKDIDEALHQQEPSWLQIGPLTKSGHPRHPSRAAYQLGMESFDIRQYLVTLG